MKVCSGGGEAIKVEPEGGGGASRCEGMSSGRGLQGLWGLRCLMLGGGLAVQILGVGVAQIVLYLGRL